MILYCTKYRFFSQERSILFVRLFSFRRTDAIIIKRPGNTVISVLSAAVGEAVFLKPKEVRIMKIDLVLASSSPRRIELLNMLGLFSLQVVSPDYEDPYPEGMPPFEAVRHIAAGKAKTVASGLSSDKLILAADTIVSLDGQILGKPRDEDEARRMLRSLSGKKHTVYTGLALLQNGKLCCDTAESNVWFRELGDAEIEAYIKTGSPLDKAGAYGAQDMAALFVERIEGEFYTVVGLPICRLGNLFRSFGVNLF